MLVLQPYGPCLVALRKESVDRNIIKVLYFYLGTVALRKESVDRNVFGHVRGTKYRKSLSARRAWIEIPRFLPDPLSRGVALRKESVDRNCEGGASFAKNYKSLSARRAWIEK